MRIFDIANPAQPKKIGEYLPGPRSTSDPGARADAVPEATVIDGRHIAVLNGTGRAHGTQQSEFLDVTDASKPRLLWRFTGPSDGEAHNGDIADSRRWWVPSGGRGAEGLRIYYLNPLLGATPQAPANLFRGDPAKLWEQSPHRAGRPVGPPFTHTHDVEIYLDRDVKVGVDEAGAPVFAKRDILLLAEGGSYLGNGNIGSAFVIDITDPSRPVVLNRWRQEFDDPKGHPVRYYHEVQFLDGDPNVMVVTDEDLHNGCNAGGLYTVRVSDDLTQAKKLAQWFNGAGTPAPVCSVHVFSTSGPYAFIGSYNAGLQVVDLTDPAAPKRAGQFIAPGANSWGALYHDGYVYVGDFGARGLDVFQFIPNAAAQGMIAPNPATTRVSGLNETLCEANGKPTGPTVDAMIVPIPSAAADGTHMFSALGSGVHPYDLKVYFYDSKCLFIAGASLNADDPDAHGSIPEGAAYAAVTNAVGAPTYAYAVID